MADIGSRLIARIQKIVSATSAMLRSAIEPAMLDESNAANIGKSPLPKADAGRRRGGRSEAPRQDRRWLPPAAVPRLASVSHASGPPLHPPLIHPATFRAN